MTELQTVIAAIERAGAGGKPAVLATLMKVAGSAYRGPGARMAVLPDGTTVGAISGGCLEKDVAAHAEKVQASGEAIAVTYDLTENDDAPWGLGMGCAAKLDVLLEPARPGRAPAHLAFMEGAMRDRAPAAVATLFRAPKGSGHAVGARLLLRTDGDAAGDLCGGDLGGSVLTDAERVLREERSDAVEYPTADGPAEVLIEYVPRPIALVACGDGNDTAPLAELGAAMGWQVRVVKKDDPLGALDDRTAAVVMTHNYPRDLILLETLLASHARYVGLLGPKARTQRLLDELKGRGEEPNLVQLAKLHAPVGLDIGAETPGEIALSIAGEIRAVLGGRAGGMLRERKGPIHDRR
ncbi:MAG: XdhC family protein [Gemmatimonadetes bacterium]|nr:XdhC family protein [Gemmatimonadota bacterium]